MAARVHSWARVTGGLLLLAQLIANVWKWVRPALDSWGRVDFLWERWDLVVKYFWSIWEFIFSPPGSILTIVLGLALVYYDKLLDKVTPTKQKTAPIEHERKPEVQAGSVQRAAEVRKVPLPPLKIPEAPLTEVRIDFKEGANGEVLAALVENTSDKPLPFKVTVESIRVWSEKQRAFVSYSTLVSKVSLSGPKVLEPDSPDAVRILAVQRFPKDQGNEIKLLAVGPPNMRSGDFNMIFYPNMPTQLKNSPERTEIFLLVLKIESDNRNTTQELFVKWDGRHIGLTGDPRK